MLGEVIREGRAARPLQRGLTIIELMIGLVVVGVLAAIAVPSMYEFIMRKRVQGVADELLVDLRLLRSAAMLGSMRNNFALTDIHFSADSTMTCYAIHPSSGNRNLGMRWETCDCLNTPVCTSMPGTGAPPTVIKLVRLPISEKVTIYAVPSSPSFLSIDHTTGLPQNNALLTVAVSAPSGGTVHVRTNGTGQGSICSVSGHGGTYAPC